MNDLAQLASSHRHLAARSPSLLEEAGDLLAHVNPTRNFVEVQRRALELLVTQLRKRKHAARASAASKSAESRSETSDADYVEAPAAPSAERLSRAGAARGFCAGLTAPLAEATARAPARWHRTA